MLTSQLFTNLQSHRELVKLPGLQSHGELVKPPALPTQL